MEGNCLEYARQLIPFPMLGLDSDNGSEFINFDLIAYCKKEEITFTRGRAYKKNDQCYVEHKNGAVVRQLVGYDRLEGLGAYKPLTDLYRAVRLSTNFFQPSMKLREKHRKSSKVTRKDYPARTPFQRLKDSGVLDAQELEKLNYISNTLDPVRLLKQIETLQDALWKHAVIINHPPRADSEDNVCFNVKECGLSAKPAKAGVNAVINTEVRNKRKYRRTKKTKTPRYWHTRKDPFENVTTEIYKWLENNPERTAKSLLLELQSRYPGQYKDSQLRTLQRRVQIWRAKAIITFDDEWLHEEVMTKKELPQLRAVMTDTISEAMPSE